VRRAERAALRPPAGTMQTATVARSEVTGGLFLPNSQYFLGMIATEVDQSFPFASVQTSTWYGTTSSRLALTRSVKDLCELLEQIERRGEP